MWGKRQHVLCLVVSLAAFLAGRPSSSPSGLITIEPSSPMIPITSHLSGTLESHASTAHASGMAQGVYFEDQITSPSPHLFLRFGTFGFLSGGTIDLSLSYSPLDASDLYFLVCSSEQYTAVTNQFQLGDDLCPDAANFGCSVNVRLDESAVDGEFTWFSTVEETSTYSLILGNCDEIDITYDMEMTLLNPGGEHLSSSYIPMPFILTSFGVVWVVLVMLWVGNSIVHRREGSIPLHTWLTIVPVTKIVYQMTALLYWTDLSANGVADMALLWIWATAGFIYQGLFMGAILLIAKGWCVTRRHLPAEEWRLLVFIVVLYAVSLFLSRVMGDFYAIALVGVYMAILRLLFAAIERNTGALKATLLQIRQAHIDATSTPYFDKFQMFKAFQAVMAAFVAVDILSFMLKYTVLNSYGWVNLLIRELLELFVYVSVGWTFRMRKWSPYYTHLSAQRGIDDSGTPVNPVQPPPSVITSGRDLETQLAGRGLTPYTPGMDLPGLDPNTLAGNAPKVFVVQNPPTLDEKGRVLPSISVASGAEVLPVVEDSEVQQVRIIDATKPTAGSTSGSTSGKSALKLVTSSGSLPKAPPTPGASQPAELPGSIMSPSSEKSSS